MNNKPVRLFLEKADWDYISERFREPLLNYN